MARSEALLTRALDQSDNYKDYFVPDWLYSSKILENSEFTYKTERYEITGAFSQWVFFLA